MKDIAAYPPSVAHLLTRLYSAMDDRRTREAEAICSQILAIAPSHAEAALLTARLATARGDSEQAARSLQPAFDRWPDNSELSTQLGLALAASGQFDAALAPLELTVARQPDAHLTWLYLYLVRDRLGDAPGALLAAYQAVTRAQRTGAWLDEATTPPELLGPVVRAIERVRTGRRELFFGSFADLRRQHGAAALQRMDRALSAYLKEVNLTPPDPRQRPRFFYFPDLPSPPYHDPFLHPWAARLAEAFPQIRSEALAVIQEDHQALPDFIPAQAGQAPDQYLGGTSLNPAWQAFFFYRHGERYDGNHDRCPVTSRLLESITLCRIADQAPEICFSVLNPQTHIKPHFGVTNTRLVMHLPLIVPRDCALHVIGGGVHEWQEGRLVMFDDTFQHEAWNRSEETRVILLMDCWNPHLTPVEREACTLLVEMISGLKPKVPRAPHGM